jgi:hypothetical protein
MWLNKVKKTREILIVNEERPITLSQPGFNRNEVPRNTHEKEKIRSVLLLLLL